MRHELTDYWPRVAFFCDKKIFRDKNGIDVFCLILIPTSFQMGVLLILCEKFDIN